MLNNNMSILDIKHAFNGLNFFVTYYSHNYAGIIKVGSGLLLNTDTFNYGFGIYNNFHYVYLIMIMQKSFQSSEVTYNHE